MRGRVKPPSFFLATQSLSTLFNSLWATLAYLDPRSRLPGAFLCNGGAFAPTQLPTLPLTQTSEASVGNHPNPQTHTIALYALQFPLGYPCLPVPSFASPRGLPVQRRGIRFHTSDPPESQRSLRCFSEGPIYPLPSLPLHPREVVRRSCPSRLIALKPRCHKASSMFERVFREGILGQMDSSGHYAESIMSRKFF